MSVRPTSPVSALGRPPFVAALGVVTLLAVVWAAAAPRPAKVIAGRRDGVAVQQQAPAEGLTAYDPDVVLTRFPGPWRQTSDAVAAVLGWAMVALVALGALACLVLVVRAWLTTREDRRPAADDAADLDLEALAVAVSGDAEQRLAALSAGTPAEGIIAAWAHLEATLHEAGVPLPASRTSTEVSLDVLRRFSVDPVTLRTLADLYREARWSHHPLTEHDRERAAVAYRELDAALRAAMPEGSRGGRG